MYFADGMPCYAWPMHSTDSCLREEPGRFKCAKVQEEFDAGF